MHELVFLFCLGHAELADRVGLAQILGALLHQRIEGRLLLRDGVVFGRLHPGERFRERGVDARRDAVFQRRRLWLPLDFARGDMGA